MRHAIDRLGVKGSVLVIKHGRPWLNYATANKADTSYLINSVQKSMTAAMIMREVQKGKISLDDRLSKYFPDITGAQDVKISNLINMTSGLDLAEGESLGTKKFVSDKNNLEADIAKTAYNPKMLGKWHYTAVNYVYLCGILSKIEKKSYEQLFKKTYIDPLKLKHTEFLWSDEKQLHKSNWVPGYEKHGDKYKRVSHAKALQDAHNELGAGSIVMSNADLARTISAMLGGSLLTNQSRSILFKGEKPKYYNGGFYNLHDYKVANGAGAGYYTFLRSTNDGKEMIIIQSNRTKKGVFFKTRNKVNQIMAVMLNLEDAESLGL